ncbi:MAG TPA: chemotaxis protein CheB [Anaeromyxobacteraceae bacterium]|nr:chemotaxis protein CheB [Anaeromyxobacteraceae bacterium]
MIRCVLADDSRVFRAILRAILSRAPDVEVVGEAADGADAVRKVVALRPDVVTMDVRMPGKDGLYAIEEIMEHAPTPIVVVSAEAGPERQDLSFRALQLGAVEVLPKPRSDAGAFEHDVEAIRTAVRAVAGLRLAPRRPRPSPPGGPPGAAGQPARTSGTGLHALAAPRVVGIVASTGGPAALARILGALGPAFPLPIAVVQHIARGFEGGLVHWLAGETALSVTLASDGQELAPGTVYLGADGRHLTVRGDRIRLDDGAPVRGFRPSGTRLLSSLAAEYGAGAAGVILSGMGDDGAAGLAEVHEAGGFTAAQGESSSVIFGMPKAAIDRGAATVTLELDEIAPALARLARGAARRA